MAILQELVNRKEYSEYYCKMKWLLPEEIDAAAINRKNLLDEIDGNSESSWAYSQTKLYTHSVSPGCALCGQGEWSCLFINGICNARCFYCPTSQNDLDPPMTNGIVFDDPKDYADYVFRFRIKGVGFSGGEPLLTFNRVHSYLEALKTGIDRPVYTWLYTNGIMVNREKLEVLRDAGLDEIRFDLSANEYQLNTLKKALNVIPRVTVELPAIPEDISTVKKLIVDLEQLGVDFLNLHQIRCTPFNVKHLINRGYTFIHGPKVTVLESELTALELIRYALERAIALPINYCSFAFRHQFQGMGARKRCAKEIKAGHEDITTTGHIRHMRIFGTKKEISGINKTLASNAVNLSLYNTSVKKERLSFASELWPLIDFSKVRLQVSYSHAVLRNSVSYFHPFKKVELNNGKALVVEKQTLQSGICIERKAVQAFGRLLDIQRKSQKDNTQGLRFSDLWEKIIPFEAVNPGLAKYY